MRLATIDLGTNTVRLLVAEVGDGGRWRVVEQDQRITRLGEGLHASGVLGAEPMARTQRAVAAYVARATDLAAGSVHIVATSAVREAANGHAFAAFVEETTGRPVRIVSGEDEARLTLRGVRAGLGPLPGRLVLFDIGGGSTEYVAAEEDRLLAAVSLRLGVVPLAERFPFPQAVDWDRFGGLMLEVKGRLERELPDRLAEGRVDHLVGTAGTVTTLAALDLGLATYDASRVQGHRLRRRAVERLLQRLGALTVEERAALPCLEPGRADLIIPGIAIVLTTMARLGTETLVVSEWGLREGLMAELVAV